ncbi:MAG: hypothetical protein AAFQ37_01845 [Bacteroidota bacterium]
MPIQLPTPDVAALQKQDAASSGIRFAAPISLDLSSTDGVWVQHNGINGRWELGFSLAGTHGMALFLDQINLPAGGELLLVNENGSLGPFSEKDISSEGRIFTGFLPGNSVKLVYEGPVFAAEEVAFHLWRADHIYRPNIYLPHKSLLDFGDSNACQINANCSEGDGWENEKSGAARTIVVVAEGVGICSGNLINNTAEDGRPLFLTGYHCQDGFTPLYDLWRFDFGYRASSCSNPSTEPSFTSYTGALERAGRQESDFLLLEIADPTFDDANHYFAGWDRSDGAVAGNLIEFHHPMGDIQKVSRDDDGGMSIITGPITWNSEVVTPGNHHFRMTYTAGTFEVGSSGSAVFDDARRIRGQLNGGNPNCPGETEAFIGRLFQSWTGGGEASNRLSDWLDPLDTNLLTLDGATLAGNTGGRVLRGRAFWLTLPLANVRLIFNWGNQVDTVFTDQSGEYSLPRPEGVTTVNVATQYLDGVDETGVNVIDIIELRRHILAFDTLSPLALLAGDVNDSGMETTGDIVQISRVILGLQSWGERPNWIVFPSVLQLDPLPSGAFGPFNITFNNPNAGVISLDFLVVKNGDVNFDVYSP